MISEIESSIGLARLQVIHLNDSRDAFNSRKDRHASIGKGTLGLAAFGRIVNHPKLKKIPLILETPKMNDEEDLINLKTVRDLYGLHH